MFANGAGLSRAVLFCAEAPKKSRYSDKITPTKRLDND
jgi:hypothetical protein